MAQIRGIVVVIILFKARKLQYSVRKRSQVTHIYAGDQPYLFGVLCADPEGLLRRHKSPSHLSVRTSPEPPGVPADLRSLSGFLEPGQDRILKKLFPGQVGFQIPGVRLPAAFYGPESKGASVKDIPAAEPFPLFPGNVPEAQLLDFFRSLHLHAVNRDLPPKEFLPGTDLQVQEGRKNDLFLLGMAVPLRQNGVDVDAGGKGRDLDLEQADPFLFQQIVGKLTFSGGRGQGNGPSLFHHHFQAGRSLCPVESPGRALPMHDRCRKEIEDVPHGSKKRGHMAKQLRMKGLAFSGPGLFAGYAVKKEGVDQTVGIRNAVHGILQGVFLPAAVLIKAEGVLHPGHGPFHTFPVLGKGHLFFRVQFIRINIHTSPLPFSGNGTRTPELCQEAPPPRGRSLQL